MKKQVLKKWIKGFFPEKQKKSNSHTNIETVSMDKKQEGWTEAQAQIVNHLINMDSIIRISKHLDQYEYATLYTINQILCQENIDMIEARKSLVGGIQAIIQQKQLKYTTKQLPFQYYSVRSLLWKVAIGYLTPNCKQKWISFMEKNLAMYKKHINQFIVQPIQKKLGLGGISPEPKQKDNNTEHKSAEKIKDHPLNFSQQSKWGNYFKDVQTWNTIQKDIKRTRKSCKFFQQHHQLQMDLDEISLKSQQITFSQIKEQTYSDCLTRIIFIYLKLHPGQVYYQGMNQMAALIYYCFTNKNSQYFRRVSESDAYFVFQIFMSRLPKKHFQKGQEYVKQFINLIKKIDIRLYEELEKSKATQMIKLVTMKWFLSGFLTQFNIDQCLLIWDTFVAWPVQNTTFIDCFYYMALSLIHLNRKKLVSGQNIALIFSKIATPTSQLIQKTQNLYKLFPKLLQK